MQRSAARAACAAALLLLAACGDRSSTSTDGLAPAAIVSDRFLSVAVDMDQLAGGTFWDPAGGPDQVPVPPYDFSRERLRNLARALAPAYLRLGGSASDRTWYDLSAVPGTPPPGFDLVLTRAQWDRANAFARELGFATVLTVAAGAGPRDAERRWTPDNARELLAYSVRRGYPLEVLEFGNEPNLFAVRAKLSGYTAEAFARDLGTFRALRDEVMPGVPIFAPGNIYTRTQGEDVVAGLVFGPRATEILPLVGSRLDGVNYHYYAAISTRCPTGPRVDLDGALEPAYLDGIDETAAAVETLRDAHAPDRPVWLTETGGQSCGGQPGVGDRFVNTFWFLNTLGRLARRGHEVVVRQTLTGSTYGLIDEVSLEPRPDYWAALLWRRLMGRQALSLPLDLEQDAAADGLRVYAHCLRDGAPGAVALLALNASRADAASLPLAGLGLDGRARLHVGSATDLASDRLQLDGVELAAAPDGTPPTLAPTEQRLEALTVAPGTWVFAAFPDARVGACGG